MAGDKIRNIPPKGFGSCHCSVGAEHSQGRYNQCLEETGLCLGSKQQSSPETRAASALLSASTPCLQCPGESMGTSCLSQDQALCLELGGKKTTWQQLLAEHHTPA